MTVDAAGSGFIPPYAAGFFSVFRPVPRLTVSEWAGKNRYLTSHGADEPGLWRNERTPYLVGIMDELFATSPTKEVVFCKGSQIGATEVGINWLLYLMDCVPGPIMALQPNTGEAEILSKQRLGPAIRKCPGLRGKVADPKSRTSGNTILAKEFDGGYLFLSGAESSSDLSGKPIGNLYLDEIDRYKDNLGKEGDPVKMALRRISNFKRAKAFFSSTPTTMASSRIWELYQDSDRRVYEVPCPECGAYQQFVFERLIWDKGDYGDVRFACGKCGSLIAEERKTSMLAAGRWRATNPGPERAGFHLSGLYSPYGWLSWGKVAKDYDKAEGDENALIVFVNTTLGLPYEDKSESLAEGFLARRVEKYGAEVPEGVLLLTMAVDVQKDRLEYEIVGWGENEESWGISYGVIRGDPTELKSGDPENPSVWEVLDRRFEKRFQHADGGDIGVSCMVVDSGGLCTDTVYQYTRSKENERKYVFSIKGGSNMASPLMNPPSRKGRVKALLFVLGVEQGKTLVHERLKREKPGPGYCHFPRDENTGYTGHYYAGLTGERRVSRVVKGNVIRKWEKIKGRHNEPFDIRVYNTAAVRIKKPDWQQLREDRQAMKGASAVRGQSAGARVRRPNRSRKPGGGVKLISI